MKEFLVAIALAVGAAGVVVGYERVLHKSSSFLCDLCVSASSALKLVVGSIYAEDAETQRSRRKTST